MLQIVPGDDKASLNVGAMLSNHPKVAKVSFTGSVPTGKKIMACAANDVKRVTLEMGGNDPAIVLGDVDIDAVGSKRGRRKKNKGGKKRIKKIKKEKREIKERNEEGM